MFEFELPLGSDISLQRMFDIQIPALEWIPASKYTHKTYKTINSFGGQKVEILVTQKNKGTLTFYWEELPKKYNNLIKSYLQESFAFPLSKINVGKEQSLQKLQRYYKDIYYMRSNPFRSLIVTILSQNKTGEATRRAFFNLATNLEEISPECLAGMDEGRLRELIRIAGPYKSKYILESCSMIISDWDGNLEGIVKQETNVALELLMRLPGVSHKTAACILVYAGLKKDILPVDTHLGRTVRRIGLVETKTKSTTPKIQRQIVEQLKTRIPEVGYAHLFFVMLGRELCHANNPQCGRCPINQVCAHNRSQI